MALVLLGVILLQGLVVWVAAQQPFSVGMDAFASSDAGLFRPMENMSLLSTTVFTTISHPFFPNYSVRIKKTDFCDGTVNAYTGYIDIEARHLFFYFFESRSNPDKDDIIFWTNGGPGCSSSVGLLMELGPCRVNDVNNVTFNPHSWNEKANIFFIDQPIGVGFSYADHGEYVSTTEEAAIDIAAFVAIFFEHFTRFKGRAFHMAGESYGGRYIPVYASAIYDQNAQLVGAGLAPINIASVMIGNGCTDMHSVLPAYYNMVCEDRSVTPILNIGACVDMKRALRRCDKWLKESCYDTLDVINCAAANSFCRAVVDQLTWVAGYNPYDLSKRCNREELEDSLCYPITKTISAFLDRPDVRKTVGVDSSLTANFSTCSTEVELHFGATTDMLFPTHLYLAALLERGVRVLIYAGATDLRCNWVGNERMTLRLEWTGQAEFVAQPLREWEMEGRRIGLTRSAGPLTFATIDGAGHMVPYDKGAESLELVKRWLAKEVL